MIASHPQSSNAPPALGSSPHRLRFLLLGAMYCFATSSLLGTPAIAQVTGTWTPGFILGGSTGHRLNSQFPANFTVHVFDNGVPLPGATVVLDFSGSPSTRPINVQ